MAAPQVCGLGALVLQLNPGLTPANLKNWFVTKAVSNSVIYNSNVNNDYTNTRSLLGGNSRFLYNPLGIESDGNLTGSVIISNGAFTLVS